MFINKYTLLSSNSITYHHTSAVVNMNIEHSSISSPHRVTSRELLSAQCITAHSWSQHPGPPMIFCAGSRDHPGIVSPWSQIFSLNTECIVNFARYNEYSGEANLCHKGCVTKPPPLPPSLPCPLRVINIIFRFVIFGEFNNTLLYNAFLSYFIQSRSR